MKPAAVGFHCPECVAEGTASVRQPAAVFGGRLPTGSRVTMTLIGVTIVAFLGQLAVGINESAGDYGMWPFGIALQGEYWRLFTAAFLHGSFLHILFNMYVLWVLGPTLESLLGHVRFLSLYVIAALGGSVASFFFTNPSTVSVGASGAIFGLMGALVVAGRRLRYDIKQVLILIGINVVIGFVVPGIDWRAHLGGLLTGAAVAAVLAFAPKANRMWWQVAGLVAIVALLAMLVVVRTDQLQTLAAPLLG